MAPYLPFDEEAWDEERWEAFLRKHDRRVDCYTELIFRFMRKYPQPDPEDAGAFASWRDALRAWLRDKGWRFDDVIMPFFWLEEEPADEELADEEVFLFDGSTPFADHDDEEDEEDAFSELERLPVYLSACTLSAEVLDWAHALSDDVKDSALVHFCSYVAQVPAHIARGFGIGHERDTLGGNIACAKRGLADANAALDLLGRMKRAPYMDKPTYWCLYEQAYEVRNEVALYVQDLRERFNLGVD